MESVTANPGLVRTLAEREGVEALARALDGAQRCVVGGSAGSSSALIAGAVAELTSRPVVLVVAHADDADEACDTLASQGVACLAYPAVQALPGEAGLALDLFADRLGVLRRVMEMGEDESPVLVSSIHALMQPVPEPSRLDSLMRTIERGQPLDPAELLDWLDRAGYSRVDAIEEPGDIALRGGIMDVFPAGGASAFRLDFFGDELEAIHEIDLDTMGSDRAIESVDLVAGVDRALETVGGRSLLELLLERAVVVLDEPTEIVEQARGYYERIVDGHGVFAPPEVLKLLESRFHALAEISRMAHASAPTDVSIEFDMGELPALSSDVGEAIGELVSLSRESGGVRVVVCCASDAERSRFIELCRTVSGADALESMVAYVHRGFMFHPSGEGAALAVVPYHELLHRFGSRRRTRGIAAGRTIDVFLDFDVGDYVVHAEHGIARFAGLELIQPRALSGRTYARERESEEYLVLEFAQGGKLNVPATRIDLVQRYVGGFKGKPPLSTLGGVRWRNQKSKVAESVRELAAEMLRVRAAREAIPGFRAPPDSPWQRSFEAEFPFEETEDQLTAIEAIKQDMQSERPMDRLICGDVGFGKTEVALRAAFKAAEAGKQVAFLVPTTLLAVQHERTIHDRMADYPFRVESMTRFKSPKEAAGVLAGLRKGEVDIVVGTHRLLSRDVRFKDLGLVVIDEEQRFGVEHKEALLRLRLTVDVLTMSATPIPRTLHMAMLGLRDISNLTTAPVDRRAIVTEVFPHNRRRIERAIARELSRDGQVYYVHNRVQSIRRIADDVRKMAPDARVVVGHGQMASGELEEVMLRFVNREADILVSTTIIESGIDIPTANTMIIDDADRFGLAELHQLRGRVGRGKHRAYCYLLTPIERTMKEVAKKRLKAIEQFSMLGAGFKIAMRDLEIRGAGNLLGAEQSGHIAAVGYEMFCQLLDRAVAELKHEAPAMPASTTTIDIGLTGVIPRAYIPSDKRRLEAYRRLAVADSLDKLREVETDLREAYGEPPKLVKRLLDLAEIRVLAAGLGVRSILIDEQDVVFGGTDAHRLAARLEGGAGSVRVVSDPKTRMQEVFFRPPQRYFEGDSLLHALRKRLSAGDASPRA